MSQNIIPFSHCVPIQVDRPDLFFISWSVRLLTSSPLVLACDHPVWEGREGSPRSGEGPDLFFLSWSVVQETWSMLVSDPHFKSTRPCVKNASRLSSF